MLFAVMVPQLGWPGVVGAWVSPEPPARNRSTFAKLTLPVDAALTVRMNMPPI